MELKSLTLNGTTYDSFPSGASVQTYKAEDIGELFAAPADYTAWCPGNLRWDKTLGKFVSLLYAAPAHVHTTADLYVTHIDPESFVATDPVKCKYLDSDGVTDITPASAGACSFLILSDGAYLMVRHMDDGNTYKFTSTDNGATWIKVSAVTGYSGHPWNMTELSNGRIIMSDDASKVGLYYSDNKGVDWTQVIPGTAGGDYEAEACVLEAEPGKLIAIARYSLDGKGYYESGDSEAAIFASSNDYGTTWTAWQTSSIDNMNASSCTGVVHDGIVEIFATSRWYSNGSNVNTDNANTGKNGAMIHYMATAQNALADNFTRIGIIDYARGASIEYHSPCAALDDKNRMLIAHMDGGDVTKCNNRYIRGELGGIGYAVTTDGASTVKAYSAKTVEDLLAAQNEKIATLQFALSQIPGSGVTPPSGMWVLSKSYVAADMKESAIYPWHEGSDFYGECVAGYESSTGDEKNNRFETDANGVTYMYGNNHTFRATTSADATDAYIAIEYHVNSCRAHVVKDGYITPVGIGPYIYDFAAGSMSGKIPNPTQGDIIEVHDGKLVINGTEYEVTRVTVEEFIAHYADNTSASDFKTHCGISELAYAGTTAMTFTENHCGVKWGNKSSYYSVKYYEKY